MKDHIRRVIDFAAGSDGFSANSLAQDRSRAFVEAAEEHAMTVERIQEGFDVFIHDGDKAIGAVRQVAPGGKAEIVIYVENAGDFVVPLSAVKEVFSEKVVLRAANLSLELRQAIGHIHDVEDPRI